MQPEHLRNPEQLGVTDARKLFGLTYRALRYYEERGLVVAHRDSMNLRWYDAKARRRLAWISRLRRAVGLDDIAEVLRVEEQEAGRGQVLALRQLEKRRVAIEDELAAIHALTAEVRSLTTAGWGPCSAKWTGSGFRRI